MNAVVIAHLWGAVFGLIGIALGEGAYRLLERRLG